MNNPTTVRELLNILLTRGLEHFKLYYGTYEALVESNEDPEKRGRIRVVCPKLYGNTSPNLWVDPRGNFAGKNVGMWFPVRKGDTVWITCRGGNSDYPMWEYGWYPDNFVPAEAYSNNREKPTNMFIRSYSGHVVELDDEEGSEVLRITSKHGDIVELNDKGISVVTKNAISLGKLNGSAEPAVLGNKNEDVHKELAAKIDAIYTAIAAAPITPADGGASFKASIVTALQGQQFPISPNITTLSTATKSKLVTLD